MILQGLLDTSSEMKRESKTLKNALKQFEGVSRHKVTNEAQKQGGTVKDGKLHLFERWNTS